MAAPPLTVDDKLEIMAIVCSPTMAMDAKRLRDGAFIHLYTKEGYVAKWWDHTAHHLGLLRNRNGDVYARLGEAVAVEADVILEQRLVIYEHLWPGARQWCARPKAEFEEPGRFVRIVE